MTESGSRVAQIIENSPMLRPPKSLLALGTNENSPRNKTIEGTIGQEEIERPIPGTRERRHENEGNNVEDFDITRKLLG